MSDRSHTLHTAHTRVRVASHRPAILPAVAILLMLCALLVTTAVRAGEESTVNGIVHITNSTTPDEGVQTVTLQELWRIGGEDDDETIFGVIVQVLLDDENIYLLDTQLSEVKVFTHDGEPVNTLGREGDGPGEFRGPGDMCFLPDGTLGVLQSFPGKVIKVNLDGTPAGTWPLGDPTQGAFYIMRGLNQGGGIVVAGGVQQSVDQTNGTLTREKFLSSLTAEGMRDVSYVTDPTTIQLAAMRLDEKELIDGPERRYDVSGEGRTVICVPRNTYEVSVFAPDGQLERVFTRKYNSWKRNAQAMGIWQRILESIERTQLPGAPISWEDTEPDVEFLRVADDGSIWILNSRAMWEPPEGSFTSYDVFTPEGHFQKQVRVACPGDPRQDMLFFAGKDRAFMVTGFWDTLLARFGGAGAEESDEEPEPMAVICYKLGK